MRGIYLIVFGALLIQNLSAQDKYLTKEGYVSFFSHSIVEDIKADNNQVLSVVDTKTGKIAIQLLMRSFMFEKALMREHFNENYVESYKFPKATFSGGKEKEISSKVTVIDKDNVITLTGDFMVEVADFNIKIPAIVANNIAKTIKVSFELHHEPYN